MARHLRTLVFAFSAALLATPAARAQDSGAVAGRVVTADGSPVADADVSIADLNRRSATDAEGVFRFENVPPGRWHVEAVSPREGRTVAHANVASGATASLTMVLDPLFHADEIVVSAGLVRARSELYQTANVLSGDELARQAQASLGETLAEEPGISSTWFGPGASRPVIRGLGGDRVRVLEDGVGVGDASNTSPDHAVSVEPLSAERIEVIRGPATLLYGSSAIGGVVNVIDERVPSELPAGPVSGIVEARGGTASAERAGALALTGRVGRVAWHVDASGRDTDDYSVPEGAHHDEEEDAEEHDANEGIVENSALESFSRAAGISWVGERGFVGASWKGLDSKYGVPGGHGHDEEEHDEDEEEHESVTIDLEQRRVDLEGAWRPESGWLRVVKGRFGISDYTHTELEGAEVGTRFLNEAWEGRLEATHGPLGPVEGALGVQASSRDFTAIGDEAFVPPTVTDQLGVFVYEELERGSLRYQLGARWERQTSAVETGTLEREFSGVSLAGGVLWSLADGWIVAASLGQSKKHPSPEELFSNGPHLATGAFEVGNPELESETGRSGELSLRRQGERLEGEAAVFVNRFEDFIFQRFTGEERDGLDLFEYVQGDAGFWGGEAHADVRLWHTDPHHLTLELEGDFVRATLVDGDRPLPRIPPMRLAAGLRYGSGGWTASAKARRVMEQDRVADREEPTPGYTMVDASVGYRFFTGGLVHDLILQGSNLTDQIARNHVSFLKDAAPLPGRDLRLIYRVGF